VVDILCHWTPSVYTWYAPVFAIICTCSKGNHHKFIMF